MRHKPLKTLLLAIVSVWTLTSQAQMAVFDAPNQVHLVATVELLQQELAQMRTLLAAVNGVRALPAVIASQSAAGNLPSNLLGLYQSLAGTSLPQAGPCVARTAQTLALCLLDQRKTGADQALAQQLYAEGPSRDAQLASLGSALGTSSDLKTSADLNARSNLAGASVESERLQVELFALQSALQEEAIAKARRADQMSRIQTSARAIDSIAPAHMIGLSQ